MVLRINLCFAADDPFVFAKRVAAAARSERAASEGCLRGWPPSDCGAADDSVGLEGVGDGAAAGGGGDVRIGVASAARSSRSERALQRCSCSTAAVAACWLRIRRFAVSKRHAAATRQTVTRRVELSIATSVSRLARHANTARQEER